MQIKCGRGLNTAAVPNLLVEVEEALRAVGVVEGGEAGDGRVVGAERVRAQLPARAQQQQRGRAPAHEHAAVPAHVTCAGRSVLTRYTTDDFDSSLMDFHTTLKSISNHPSKLKWTLTQCINVMLNYNEYTYIIYFDF